MLNHIAQNFSSPVSNGEIPKIYVSYPIKPSDKAIIFNTTSYVIFDNVMMEDPCGLRARLKIKCAPGSFEYLGRIYSGDYCILQIISHPQNSKIPIVYISYSNSLLLNKILFLRKIILPGFCNKRHPYLNCEALIYYKKNTILLMRSG